MTGRGPLQGLRIVDLTRALAGPYCTMLLADLGADVIKIEAPEGDLTRRMPPWPADRERCDYGGYFASINRNKRSVVLDLKSERGREVVLRLVDSADALVENFRAGVMERLELAYEDLARRKPSLVYAAVRGFGDPRTGKSPYRDWPAFDIVAQCMGGVVGTTGETGGRGLRAGPAVGDIFPGTLAALGVVSALLHAQRSGQGQFLDVAMYDGVLTLCESIVYNYAADGTEHHPAGNAHPALCPFDVFETEDGAVAIAAPTDHHWVILCELMGHAAMGADERYASNADRVARAREVRAWLSEWTRQHTTAQIVGRLAKRVPVGPVNLARDIFADPHMHARDMLVEVERPGDRPLTVAGPAIKLTETPAGIYRRAPMLGEHTHEILEEIGFAWPRGEEENG
jgi:crotonobetainyl-CoA:carnitine CoA-transferase CaiB-like acyl-CoA transferase